MALIHKRKKLRYACARILTGQTVCGSNVFANRPTPAFESELPGIFVYTVSEPASLRNEAPRVYKRECKLITEIIAHATVNSDDVVDDIAAVVEDIMFRNGYLRDPTTSEDTLDGLCDLENTEIGLFDEGDKITSSCKITWNAPYESEAPEPTSAEDLDAFAVADVKIAKNDNTAVTLAEDLATIPQ